MASPIRSHVVILYLKFSAPHTMTDTLGAIMAAPITESTMNKTLPLMLLVLALLFPMAPCFSKDADTKEVKSYTRKDGTVVKGYTRKKSAKDADTEKIASYTKKDGTVVKGYTRKKVKKTDK
jgi:hypothetical protein